MAAISHSPNPEISEPAPKLGLCFSLLAVQALFWLMTALCLDHGVLNRACTNVFIGYWAGVLLIVLRRGNRPTRSDLMYIKWGWLALMLIGILGAYTYWHWVRAI